MQVGKMGSIIMVRMSGEDVVISAASLFVLLSWQVRLSSTSVDTSVRHEAVRDRQQQQLFTHLSPFQLPQHQQPHHNNAMPTSSSGRRAPLLPATLFLAAALAWPCLEALAIQGYDGTVKYSLSIESLSDLGVNYRQVHPLKHHPVTSWMNAYQNFNFMQAGILFGLAHLALLYITRHRATDGNAPLRTIRVLLTLFYAAGMILMGRIRGGPREKHWEIIGWHWTGMTLAAIAGNLNSIIAAAAPNQIGGFDRITSYRALSALLGLFGLYSFFRFQTLGEWDFETQIGRWQRGTIYPVLLWEAVTAGNIIIANRSGEFAKAKTL